MHNMNLVTQIRANLPNRAEVDEPTGVELLVAIYKTLSPRDQALLEHISLLMVARRAGKS